MDEDFEDEEWPFGCEGGPEDILAPSGVGSAEVSKLLARADGEAGEFSFGGVADTLPVAPGLFVDGLGAISTPLYAEQAEKLIALCEKSPFGHNMDTKLDDNVRKSWQLQPNLIEFKNPLWQTGIENLSKTIASRLGYKDIPLKCLLYKLLVYGEGGHFVKHQDTEKEDGMIATLVVQPPSMHQGGDLVVYRDAEVKYRHDFGKADNSAAYQPHYAVHYADAEHALEKVTKGYRLALVYSICLPPTMRHLERQYDVPLTEELANAIAKMKGDDDSFALLLAHEYTENSIRNMGSGALKGVDSARFHALDGANALVPEDKKLLFFIVQLQHDVSYNCGGYDYEKTGHNDSATWFTRTGKGLGRVAHSTEKLNILNPGQEALESIWSLTAYGKMTKRGGYVGNESSKTVSTYTRYAIVAWPATKHSDKALKFMPMDVAAEALHCRKPVSAEEVSKFLEGASARIETENKKKKYGEKREVFSTKFFRLVCELLAGTGDPKAVNSFFTTYCGALGGVEDNEAFIPPITAIVRTFDWSDIGDSVLKALGSGVEKDDDGRGREINAGLSSLKMTLRVIDGLASGTAQQALVKKSVEIATQMADKELFTSKSIGLLWKWVIHSDDKKHLETIANKFREAETSLLGPSIQYLSQHLSNTGNDVKSAVLDPVVPLRVKWLEDQIKSLDKKFSWEMPTAKFSENKKIEEFLRGPEQSMTTKGVEKFKEFQEAKNYAAKHTPKEQVECSFELEAAEIDGNSFVAITKTRDCFLAQQKMLVNHQKELHRLKEQFGEVLSVDGAEKKRARADK
ncbi:hypothetical protein L917_17253 [Phytophthora nicotianae]|uniref:Fe2OG dioxygenase domain-containing protein n=1 Tax=Phytophthora nicotianae TaxID=4792 RepID=W2KE22_PHYNI|nr:hypothetical protein L917_17253 [Phytophthora nicotianae]